MSSTALSKPARRLHLAAISLLILQFILAGGDQPLRWGGLLLTLMAGLKLAESRRGLDLQRAALTELMAVGVMAVIAPELGPSLLQAITALMVVAALLCQEAGDRQSLGQSLRRSLQIGLAVLPLLLLLFLLMPRIGPLWSMPGRGTGHTGLSDQLDTGTISRLVQDPTPAARVTYLKGSPPPPSERYWRVLVLDHFDGRRWSAPPAPPPPTRRRLAVGGLEPAQLWVVEPRRVAALPWPGAGVPRDANLTINAQGVLQSDTGSATRRRFGLVSSDAPPAWQRQSPQVEDLAFPPGVNPRLEALGRSWAVNLPPKRRVDAARQLFEAQRLRYTVSPPLLPDAAPLDALLFSTRAGFCEHFASTFTALMRAAGIPARVVIGYQGGEWVPNDSWGSGYLDVRQRDAHAWSEVWLEPSGWIRVDPTEWVSPQRIAGGIQAGLGDSPADWARLAPRLPWMLQLERTWNKLDLAWNRWVIAFDTGTQQQLLGPWHQWQGAFLIGSLSLVLPIAAWWLQYQASRGCSDRTRRELDRTLCSLFPLGLQLQPGEGLEGFCDRASARLPSMRDELKLLAETYAALRFSKPSNRGHDRMRWKEANRRLDAALRRIHPMDGTTDEKHLSIPRP